jgi:Recombination endonuclease VII
MSAVKQFCIRGHDTFAVGRLPNRSCCLCHSLGDRIAYASHKSRVYPPKERMKFYSMVKRQYGLAANQWDALAIATNGHCGICFKQFRDGSWDCNLDHNHTTKAVRSLLCHRCNIRLSALEDLPYRDKADTYLAKYKPSGEPITWKRIRL